eukprot:gb/GEZN01016574.1/.p1 GENE.gb/GEZN01016574.1/~~gb/GEZN01016574.1/.p1  ORF type:complete len:214 (-),score=30.71 gb/GEZN01016574.1/:196-762(-)
MLLNVAGVGPVGYLQDGNADRELQCCYVNTLPVVMLTKLMLPMLQTRQRYDGLPVRSAILNVASIFGTFPIPACSVYSGTKALVDFFTRAVAWECKKLGAPVDVMTLRPLAVSTPLIFKQTPDGLETVTPDQCAKGALEGLGHDSETWGARGHQFLGALQSNLPLGLRQFLFHRMIMQVLQKQGLEHF